MNDTGKLETQSPKTIEEVAMSKLSDPFSEPYPFIHITDESKLEPILSKGIISANFAERAGVLSYRRSFRSSWNDSSVSIVKGSPSKLWGLGLKGGDLVGVLVKPISDPVEATKELACDADNLTPQGDEYLVKNRIAPREICGIVLKRDQRYKPSVLNKIVQIFGYLNPSLAMPVYRESDGLVWPEQLTREQLRDRVQSQR